MADEDIYNNKRRYERLVRNFAAVQNPDAGRTRQRRYFCRNAANLRYFEQMHRHFESQDMSYIRRNKVLHRLRFLTWATDKDLAECNREDIDRMVALGHQTNRTIDSKKDFLRSIKRLWKVLFPERDAEGRIADDLVPYPVRHLSCRVDKSHQRRREDKITPSEFEQIVGFFSSDAQMQAFITLALESLGRPQEMCYTRIKDVDLHENYARVWISSHGKEGVKFLHCIDSYVYLLRWLEVHPFRNNPDAFLFHLREDANRPMTPPAVNKRLRKACLKLGITNRITAYSLKRNGVTFRRLRGDSDVEIQHVAGWTSTKQLQTYDLSTPEDSFKQQLVRRGLVSGEQPAGNSQASRLCICGATVGFADKTCHRCKRVVDPALIKREMEAEQEMREVMTMALKQPNRSLAELMDEWRRRNMAEQSKRTGHQLPRTVPTA